MRAYRALSIRTKMQAIILFTAGAALLVSCVAFLAYDLVTFRSTMKNGLSTLADLIGSNSTAALTFNDPNAAREILQGLKAQSHIVSACIYSGDGKVFTTYRREGGQQNVSPPGVRPAGIEFKDDRLVVFHRITLDGQKIGTVYLESDLKEMRSRVYRYLAIVTLILITSLFLAFLLASKLQQVISDPILHLAETARVISAEKNYSIRAVKQNEDEVGLLIEGFNEMLTQIQHRDQELERHREHLEEDVAARTEELSRANRKPISTFSPPRSLRSFTTTNGSSCKQVSPSLTASRKFPNPAGRFCGSRPPKCPSMTPKARSRALWASHVT